MRLEFFQHLTSGDMFVVELDRQKDVVASFGPLTHDELSKSSIFFNPAMSPEDNEWFKETEDEWRILSREEVLQLADYPDLRKEE